jgi:hypothetical protein
MHQELGDFFIESCTRGVGFVNRALCGSVHHVCWRRTEFQLRSLDEIVQVAVPLYTKLLLLPLCSKCVTQAMDTAVEREDLLAEQQQMTIIMIKKIS